MEYVVGFMFKDQSVALIKKTKPKWQAGLLNGIGGKIEEGETPEQAMSREFFEEAGWLEPCWRYYAVLKGSDWTVHFFTAESSDVKIKTTTDEEVCWYNYHDVEWFDTIPNLNWLVPLAKDKGNLFAEIIDPSHDLGKE